MKQIILGRTFYEQLHKTTRVIIHKEDGFTIYALNKKDIQKKDRKDVFTINKCDYVYMHEFIQFIGKKKIPTIQYFENCAIPFRFGGNDDTAIPEWADSKKLHDILEIDLVKKYLGAGGFNMILILVMVLAIPIAFMIGVFLGGKI